MKENLITSGILYPALWPLAQIRQQVAAFLHLLPQQILRMECWPHQIWVNIAGVGARFVSYRALPLWTQNCLLLLQRCSQFPHGCNLDEVQGAQEKLERLRAIFWVEVQQHGHHYPTGALPQLRQAWSKQKQILQHLATQHAEAEERNKPWRDRLQQAQEWKEAWERLLSHCHHQSALDYLLPVLQMQINLFHDVPEVLQAVSFTWNQCWQRINQMAQSHAVAPAVTSPIEPAQAGFCT